MLFFKFIESRFFIKIVNFTTSEVIIVISIHALLPVKKYSVESIKETKEYIRYKIISHMSEQKTVIRKEETHIFIGFNK